MAKQLSVSELLDVYGAFLSEKQQNLADLYYNEDLSLSEIAENEGITRQAVSELIRRTEAQLEAWEGKCGYLKKLSEIKKSAVAYRDNKTDENMQRLLLAVDEI